MYIYLSKLSSTDKELSVTETIVKIKYGNISTQKIRCSMTPQRSKIVTYFIYSEASETTSGWINVDLLECNPELLNRSYKKHTFYV